MRIFDQSNNRELELQQISLVFEGEKYTNKFALKNNKTLEETIANKKYQKYANVVHEHYSNFLSMNLGEFLLKLKIEGDQFYSKFLNKYGDLEYCRFGLADQNDEHLKGVYFYYENEQLRYVGRCRDNMKNRINNGYGSVSPKNCFIDGQSTNCHLNARISNCMADISLCMFIMEENSEIEILEMSLIEQYRPQWNVRK